MRLEWVFRDSGSWSANGAVYIFQFTVTSFFYDRKHNFYLKMKNMNSRLFYLNSFIQCVALRETFVKESKSKDEYVTLFVSGSFLTLQVQ